MLGEDTWHLVRTQTGKPEVLVCSCRLAKPLRSQEVMRAVHDRCWHTAGRTEKSNAETEESPACSKGKPGCHLSSFRTSHWKRHPKKSPGEGWAELYTLGVLGKNAPSAADGSSFTTVTREKLQRKNKHLGVNCQKHQYFKILERDQKGRIKRQERSQKKII